MATITRQRPEAGQRPTTSILERLDATVPRLCAALRGASSGSLPVPGMRWRVGELGAHIAQTGLVLREAAEGRVTAYGERGEFNAAVDQRLVDELPERDPDRLAALTEERYTALRAVLVGRLEDELLPRLQGYSVAALCAVWVIDLNVHGYQIGQAGGHRFAVDNRGLRQAMEIVLPFAVDETAGRGFRATYAMHITGTDPLVYTFDDGSVRMEGNGARVDCHIGLDPVAFLLVTLGVMPQWRAILTLKMRAWGRRPWLAQRISTLIPRVPHGGTA